MRLNSSSIIEKKNVLGSHLSTPANFRSDLASRPVTGSLLHVPRPSRNPPTQRNSMPMEVEQFGGSDERSDEYPDTQELPPDQGTLTAHALSDELTESQRYYAESLQYNALPYATPVKPSGVFGLPTPQTHKFEYDHYQHRSPLPSERVGLNRRSFQPPRSPATHSRPPQSPYFPMDQSRIHITRSAAVSASRGKDSPIPRGPRAQSSWQKSQYWSHGSERTNSILRDRLKPVGPVRSSTESDSGFVARLAMRGGRQL